MSGRKQRISQRNEQIKQLVQELIEKHPQWRMSAVIDETSSRFFLAPRTVEAIIKGEGVYAN